MQVISGAHQIVPRFVNAALWCSNSMHGEAFLGSDDATNCTMVDLYSFFTMWGYQNQIKSLTIYSAYSRYKAIV